ncbi:glycosyltransferase [Microbacterium sp. nov. GSS16]|uniref:glycosyltransferase n=1 Tax=Microbacterium sp. nov. GSS16 TaxID=3019890 RepID=UPI002305E1AD|nr:glycosyltransferase [Microbacterium sp. nov. GSS16]WCD92541.1 glycosyltransferase [Microbacterium sp. nov. GSS16]
MVSNPGRGTIVLAAYEPNPELFARQISSLRGQTLQDWECVISVDGDDSTVRRVVAEAAGEDPRFRVIADGTRLGFYLNFERGLAAMDPTTSWVALCDQDDYWYPEKLETLVPHLDEVALVSGQARLVTHPDEVTTGFTERRDLGGIMTTLNNQFTGSLCVLRGELATRSLPFPRMSTRAAAHDHWLAVLAAADGGTRILDDVVQDYVQHDSNVFGDPSRLDGKAGLRAVVSAIENARAFTRRYEPTGSLLSMMRMYFKVYVGWRQLMAMTLASRVPDGDARIVSVFGVERRFWPTWRMLRDARRAGHAPARFVIEYLGSWMMGVVIGGRRSTVTQPLSTT